MNKLKPIPSLPDYWAASDGTVWRFHNRDLAPIKAHLKKNGYLAVNVRTADGWEVAYVHLLILEAWAGTKPTPTSICRHLSGCSTDNRPENLAWGTHADNTRDRVAHGRSLVGAANPAAKLDYRKAFAMREAHALGATVEAIAGRYGVSETTVRDVLNNKRWVEEPPQAALAA